MTSYRDQILCWAVIRYAGLKPVVLERFRTRTSAENYLGLVRRSLPVAPYEIIFDQGGWADE